MNVETKKEIQSKYMAYLCKTTKTYAQIGRFVKGVDFFLDNVESVTRSQYLKFKREHAALLSQHAYILDAACDLMSFYNVGYRRKMASVRTLEKLSVISEKNRATVNGFLDNLTTEYDYSPNTLSVYSVSVNQFFQYCNEFTSDNVRRFIKTLEEQGIKPATLRLRITALERLGLYLKKPITIKRPKIPKKLDIDNVPTSAEYDRLLQFLHNRRNQDGYFYVKVLGTTGMRISELMKITWEDISRGEVILRGKGNKYRRIFFTKNVQQEVKEYIRKTGKNGHFLSGKFGELSSRGFDQNLKDWGSHCDIPSSKMHAHAFRHFFAKMFLKKNNDVIQLAELLGHGSIDTTRIYLKKSYDEQKRDFNKSVTW